MQKSDYNQQFDLAFRTCNQAKFEEWFAQLAGCVYGADFERIKAGGPQGDKKCDGRQISTETVFQCYAPESAAAFARNAKAKIENSFPDVLTFWPNLKNWIFVHNNDDGVTSAISDCLEVLREKYHHLTIKQVSRRFLKDELHDKLSMQQLIDVYPSASLNYGEVTMDVIRILLKKIIEERTPTSAVSGFGDIPNEAKLDFNGLSPDAKYEIQRARPHVNIVERYLNGMSNPQNATNIQDKVRAKYIELHDLGHIPDDIFGRMLTFVGGDQNPTVSASAYVILAYYFDSCDIFKNVMEGVPC